MDRNGVLPFCLVPVEHLSFTCDELDAERETVPTVSRSEGVWGLCTLPCPSPQTTILELLPLHSEGKGFERLKHPAERQWTCTEKQLSRCFLAMFFHSMHEHLLLEEMMWAALSGMGQASCAGPKVLALCIPQCFGQDSVLADCSLLRTSLETFVKHPLR